MKYFIGSLVILVLLFILTYFLLSYWGISMMDSANFNKTVATIGILAVSAIIFTAIIAFFFKDGSKGYDKTKGNVAHPKN